MVASQGNPNMTRHDPTQPTRKRSEFESQAEQSPPGLLAELAEFLVHHKKWWLAPIIVLLLLLGVLVVLGTSSAPFIYALF